MLMVLIVFINTLLRYCFNSGIVENEELLRYMFIWITFLGIVSVYYENRHIAVTMLTDRLSPKVRNLFEFCANFLVLYALYVLTSGSLMYMEDSATTVGQLTNIRFTWIIVAAVFAGIACFGIVLRDMFRQLKAALRGEGA